MISVEVCMDILSLHRQGMSNRAIAHKLGIHRNTVKKYIEKGGLPAYKENVRQTSILDPYRQLIDDYLAEDNYQATWLYDRLQNMGYSGSYKTVQLYVRSVKERRTRLAFSRFESEPGWQAQVDWGDFQIDNPDGSTTTLYLFLMVLGFSRAMYLEFVEKCTLEVFLDCSLISLPKGKCAVSRSSRSGKNTLGNLAGHQGLSSRVQGVLHHHGHPDQKTEGRGHQGKSLPQFQPGGSRRGRLSAGNDPGGVSILSVRLPPL